MAYFPEDRNIHQLAPLGPIKLLNRLYDRLINQAMTQRDFGQALDLVSRNLQLREDKHALWSHIDYTDRSVLELAAIYGRKDIIEKAMEFELLGIKLAEAPSLHPEDMARAFHARSQSTAIDAHSARLKEQESYLANVSRYESTVTSVVEDPGIRQIDLAKKLNLETAAATRLIDQLEAAGLVATMKVANRISVWPEGHPNGPSQEQRRTPRWYFGMEPFNSEEPDGLTEESVPSVVQSIEQLLTMYSEALVDKAADDIAKPTPLDFSWPPVDLIKSRGIPTHMDSDHRILAFWGHIDLEAASQIAEQLIQDIDKQELPIPARRQWLKAEPRYVHVERMRVTSNTYTSKGSNGWVLTEVPEASDLSVPVTVVAAAGAITDPAFAATKNTACWLPR